MQSRPGAVPRRLPRQRPLLGLRRPRRRARQRPLLGRALAPPRSRRGGLPPFPGRQAPKVEGRWRASAATSASVLLHGVALLALLASLAPSEAPKRPIPVWLLREAASPQPPPRSGPLASLPTPRETPQSRPRPLPPEPPQAALPRPRLAEPPQAAPRRPRPPEPPQARPRPRPAPEPLRAEAPAAAPALASLEPSPAPRPRAQRPELAFVAPARLAGEQAPAETRRALPLPPPLPRSRPPIQATPPRLPAPALAPSEPARSAPPPAPSGLPRPAAPSRSSAPKVRLAGVALGSLSACLSEDREQALRQRLLSAIGSRTECSSEAGRWRFLQTRNLNSFLVWVERAAERRAGDRCEELGYAIACVEGGRQQTAAR